MVKSRESVSPSLTNKNSKSVRGVAKWKCLNHMQDMRVAMVGKNMLRLYKNKCVKRNKKIRMIQSR